jgi:hypothetical protein
MPLVEPNPAEFHLIYGGGAAGRNAKTNNPTAITSKAAMIKNSHGNLLLSLSPLLVAIFIVIS